MGLGERCNVHEVVRVRLLEDVTSEQSPEAEEGGSDVGIGSRGECSSQREHQASAKALR